MAEDSHRHNHLDDQYVATMPSSMQDTETCEAQRDLECYDTNHVEGPTDVVDLGNLSGHSATLFDVERRGLCDIPR